MTLDGQNMLGKTLQGGLYCTTICCLLLTAGNRRAVRRVGPVLSAVYAALHQLQLSRLVIHGVELASKASTVAELRVYLARVQHSPASL